MLVVRRKCLRLQVVNFFPFPFFNFIWVSVPHTEVLQKSCNQILLIGLQSQILPLGFPVPLSDPAGWGTDVGFRTFTTLVELLVLLFSSLLDCPPSRVWFDFIVIASSGSCGSFLVFECGVSFFGGFHILLSMAVPQLLRFGGFSQNCVYLHLLSWNNLLFNFVLK